MKQYVMGKFAYAFHDQQPKTYKGPPTVFKKQNLFLCNLIALMCKCKVAIKTTYKTSEFDHVKSFPRPSIICPFYQIKHLKHTVR